MIAVLILQLLVAGYVPGLYSAEAELGTGGALSTVGALSTGGEFIMKHTVSYYLQGFDITNTEAVADACELLQANQDYYEQAVAGTTVPWPLIAVMHYLEADGDMTRQIFNGQRWDRKTTKVPKGLGPWQSWVMSTRDYIERYIAADDLWTPAEMLFFLEGHNGWGYANLNRPSPYIYGCTNLCATGRFVADGHFDPTAMVDRPGAAPLLRMLYFGETPLFRLGATGERVKNLQRFLNSVTPAMDPLKLDGELGAKTAQRFTAVFGVGL